MIEGQCLDRLTQIKGPAIFQSPVLDPIDLDVAALHGYEQRITTKCEESLAYGLLKHPPLVSDQ